MQNTYNEKHLAPDYLVLLSQYRTTLMGIAMLWVVLHHCNFNTKILYEFPLLDLGYSGVDIFILVSCFGIYCSLNQMSDVSAFLLKRFIPAYAIIVIYILYLKITSLHVIIGFLTFENFWINNGFLYNRFLKYVR